MLGTLYLLSLSGAVIAAMHQARLIKAGRPIRHGFWLAAYVAVGVVLAAVIIRSWWFLAALVGMAGTFSMYFRFALNAMRGKLPSYMGPDLSSSSLDRSRYDLFCWNVAARLGWTPHNVALAMEITASVGTALIFTFLYP